MPEMMIIMTRKEKKNVKQKRMNSKTKKIGLNNA